MNPKRPKISQAVSQLSRKAMPRHPGQAAFTLIELLMVIAIIAIFTALFIGDKQPYGNPPIWSSSLWWASACVDPAVGSRSSFPTCEGMEPKHLLGMVVGSFNDGHSEARKGEMINPPANPADRTARVLINSHYWDPLQRAVAQ
jgi:prepilin-type N-terminal cleavage/methylation domain-containing protein